MSCKLRTLSKRDKVDKLGDSNNVRCDSNQPDTATPENEGL